MISLSGRVRDQIQALDLDPFVEKAQELFRLRKSEVTKAVREYRHFLYLIYWNRRLGHKVPIVPTKRADAIWHAHLLHTVDYRRMCESVFGSFLDHQPGLKEGTPRFIDATKHTRRIHNHVYAQGKHGFEPGYFSHIVLDDTTSSRSKDRSDSGGCSGFAGGGSSGGKSSHASDAADAGGDGGGCGGGCGG